MMPWSNAKFCRFLRNFCYPSVQSLALLGPLTNKIVLFAPLFEIVPPNGDGNDQTESLPTNFERQHTGLLESMVALRPPIMH
jgi:hypothetical protein